MRSQCNWFALTNIPPGRTIAVLGSNLFARVCGTFGTANRRQTVRRRDCNETPVSAGSRWSGDSTQTEKKRQIAIAKNSQICDKAELLANTLVRHCRNEIRCSLTREEGQCGSRCRLR